MRMLLGGVALLLLVGCTAAGGLSSEHAYQGEVENFFGATVRGTPTIVPEGSTPMGYRGSPDGAQEDMYSTYDDGVIKATGRAAWYIALSRLCTVAPDASSCTSAPDP